jgi:hypothetical protein
MLSMFLWNGLVKPLQQDSVRGEWLKKVVQRGVHLPEFAVAGQQLVLVIEQGLTGQVQLLGLLSVMLRVGAGLPCATRMMDCPQQPRKTKSLRSTTHVSTSFACTTALKTERRLRRTTLRQCGVAPTEVLVNNSHHVVIMANKP